MLPVFLLSLVVTRILMVPVGAKPAIRPTSAAIKPIRVFVLSRQSNMEGQSMADLDGPDYNEGRGTVQYPWRDAEFRREFAYLRGPGDERAVREDVQVRGSHPVRDKPDGWGRRLDRMPRC